MGLSAGAKLVGINDKSPEDAMVEFDHAFFTEYAAEGRWMSDRMGSNQPLGGKTLQEIEVVF